MYASLSLVGYQIMAGVGSEPTISAYPRYEARQASRERTLPRRYRTESQ